MVFILVGCILLSCNENNKLGFIYLYADNVDTDEPVYMKYPYRVKIIDSVIYVLDLYPPENYLHAFSYPTINYLYSFGKRGDGPDEITANGGFIVTKDSVATLDINKAKLLLYSTSDLSRGEYGPSKIVSFPRDFIPMTKIVKNKEGYISIDNTLNNRLLFFDSEGLFLNGQYEIPTSKTVQVEDIYKAILWTSDMSFNSNNNILALATVLGEVIEIYNLSNNTKEVIIGENGEPALLKGNKSISLGRIEGYSDIIVADNEIYTIFSGVEMFKLSEMYRKGENPPNGGNKIYVYDLSGNMLRKYLLDRYINGFYIDTENKEIYAVDSNSDSPLCRFKF